MSRGLFIGVIVLTLLAGGVYWSEKAKKAEEGKPDPNAAPKLVTVQPAEIQRITIKRKDAEPVVVERASASSWKIVQPAGLRADDQTVSGIVTALTDLRWERLLEEKGANPAEFGLGNPNVTITFGAAGKERKLLIGDETPTGGNFFAKLEGDPRIFTINSGAKSSMDRSAQDLRDKRLVPFDAEKTTNIEVRAQGKTLELAKSGSDWHIVKPAPLRADSFQVEELLRRIKEAKMDEDKVSFFSLRPIASIKVTTPAGVQSLEIRQKSAGKTFLAKSSAVEGVHKIPEEFGKSLESGVEQFKNKKLFDFGFNDPAKVEVRDGAQQWHFVKGGEKWWLNGKEMDPAGTQIVIDKLRDLTASQFSTKKMPPPTGSFAVTYSDGKKTERVNVATVGEVALAQREGEPVIYEVPKTAIAEVTKASADVKPVPPKAKQGAK